MNFVTTNIRIPEEDYLRLKTEAAKKRTSLAGVIRERIQMKKVKKMSPQAAIVSLEDLEKIQQAKVKATSLDMLKLAIESREELKSLPSNLRKRANEILYG